ncbi:MAG: hypothetical protein NTZ83_00750 [Candidatus Pacearchaeota archaeon]|nr:hypothetical protein [Candidatus Pacearchaeota archaeon]
MAKRSSNNELNKFLNDSGYKNQSEVVHKLIDEGVFSGNNFISDLARFNYIIHGKRPAPIRFIKGLEKISIDSKEFMKIVEVSREEYMKEHSKQKRDINLFEKEADNLYQKLKTSISSTDDIYKKMDLIRDFKEFVDKYSKKE